jgi:hypothetical protein
MLRRSIRNIRPIFTLSPLAENAHTEPDIEDDVEATIADGADVMVVTSTKQIPNLMINDKIL